MSSVQGSFVLSVLTMLTMVPLLGVRVSRCSVFSYGNLVYRDFLRTISVDPTVGPRPSGPRRPAVVETGLEVPVPFTVHPGKSTPGTGLRDD